MWMKTTSCRSYLDGESLTTYNCFLALSTVWCYTLPVKCLYETYATYALTTLRPSIVPFLLFIRLILEWRATLEPFLQGAELRSWPSRPELYEIRRTVSLCEFPIQSRSHAKWMITFIDDALGFATLHFQWSKADAVTALKDLVAWADSQTGFHLCSICLDRGGEYINQSLKMFLSSRGIEHQTSVPHTPQQNGQAEHFNQTILEKSEAMCQHACLLFGKML